MGGRRSEPAVSGTDPGQFQAPSNTDASPVPSGPLGAPTASVRFSFSSGGWGGGYRLQLFMCLKYCIKLSSVLRRVNEVHCQSIGSTIQTHVRLLGCGYGTTLGGLKATDLSPHSQAARSLRSRLGGRAPWEGSGRRLPASYISGDPGAHWPVSPSSPWAVAATSPYLWVSHLPPPPLRWTLLPRL